MRKMKLDVIWPEDCLTGMMRLPPESVQCCVTSPPYWRLRDYNVDGQLGMEDSPEEYVSKLVAVFEQVRRVMKPDGTLWLNLGDCYWGSGKHCHSDRSKNQYAYGKSSSGKHPEIKAKDLIGIPWMVAFALRRQGWWLRQDIIWHKKNCMPESVKDRCTRAHETIFMFSKSPKYYYNAAAISTPLAASTRQDKRISDPAFFNRVKNYQDNAMGGGVISGVTKTTGALRLRSDKQSGHSNRHARFNERWRKRLEEGFPVKGANRRTVWVLPYQPFKGQHFATFPPALPELCIKAGSKPGDVILDPFIGAGTTALVARDLKRHFVGFELNPEYVDLAEQRLALHQHDAAKNFNGG